MIDRGTIWNDLTQLELEEYIYNIGTKLQRDMYEVVSLGQRLGHLPKQYQPEASSIFYVGEYESKPHQK